MPSKNLKKDTKGSGDENKQGEKGKPAKKQPPKKTDSPKISEKSKATKGSGDVNKQGEKGKPVKKQPPKKTDSSKISEKSKATKNSGDVNKQGEKGKPVQKQQPKKTDGPKISVKSKGANDKCSLFIKPIKKRGMRDEISNLSKDIQAVKFKPFRKSTKETPLLYAILIFVDEATAEKNYKMLQGKKCGDENLIVDFVGEKSVNKKNEKNEKKKKEKKEKRPKAEDLDKLKLHVTGFKSSPTEPELKKLFPKSQQIDIPVLKNLKKSFGFAFIGYANEKLAKEALESMQKSSLVVRYAPKLKPKA